MSRFEFSSGARFSEISKVGNYLTSRLGPGYKFEIQTEELKTASVGSRGDLTRWLNEQIFGNLTLVLSNNPFFGTAIRFYDKRQGTLLIVRGILPHQTLRNVLPLFALAVMFGALIGLQNGIGIAIFLATLPLCLILPRLCAMPLTARVGRFLADADACRAAGIDPPPVHALDFANASPEEAAQFRIFGIAKVILGFVTAAWATQYATTQLGRPYTQMLWEDTLIGCSIAAGLGLLFIYVGVNNLCLRRVGWLMSILLCVVLCGLCAGVWAIMAPQICPPR